MVKFQKRYRRPECKDLTNERFHKGLKDYSTFRFLEFLRNQAFCAENSLIIFYRSIPFVMISPFVMINIQIRNAIVSPSGGLSLRDTIDTYRIDDEARTRSRRRREARRIARFGTTHVSSAIITAMS